MASRGQRLMNAINDKRVIAIPSKKVKRTALDEYGNVVLDKDGKAVTKEVTLYRIHKMQ